jgi:hypothetical protein
MGYRRKEHHTIKIIERQKRAKYYKETTGNER